MTHFIGDIFYKQNILHKEKLATPFLIITKFPKNNFLAAQL